MNAATTLQQVAPAATPVPAADMIGVDSVLAKMEGRGFERIDLIRGETYRDSSTVVIIPTRGTINYRVVQSWQNLIAPMNQKRAIFFATGHEVGKAYDAVLAAVLANPNLSTWKYVLTLEDDNLQPADAHIRLLETIEQGGFDAVSGLYWTKGEMQQPMCYGDPERYRQTGVLDFAPRDVRTAVAQGTTIECNGIAMGCALWRMDLFRKIGAPWFQTVADVVNGGVAMMTQDLFFCERAKRAGSRFAVDARVRVGHLNLGDGIVY